jgi:hypothetical protein
MLQEVSQAPLLGTLVQAASVHHEVCADAVGREGVGLHQEAQAIGQRAMAEGWVQGQHGWRSGLPRLRGSLRSVREGRERRRNSLYKAIKGVDTSLTCFIVWILVFCVGS